MMQFIMGIVIGVLFQEQILLMIEELKVIIS